MYVGHVGVALGVRGRTGALPLWLLVLAAQGCDWGDALLEAAWGLRGPDAAPYTHSLPAVVAGALLPALLATAIGCSAGATLLAAGVYLSHWPLDLVTGLKPTWSGGPILGLDLYSRPWWDLPLEAAVIVGGWWLYRRALPLTARQRPVLLILLATLLALQALGDVVFLRRALYRRGRTISAQLQLRQQLGRFVQDALQPLDQLQTQVGPQEPQRLARAPLARELAELDPDPRQLRRDVGGPIVLHLDSAPRGCQGEQNFIHSAS